MEIKWLKDFLVLSEEGNFRASAKLRNVSQPAFSRRIQALERFIGAPLIDRNIKPVQLTKEGQVFHPIALDIINLLEVGKQEIQDQVQKENKKIRFATLSTLSKIFLPTWLKNLQPHISITQFIIKTQYVTLTDYFAALDENHVDFFISYLNPKIGLLHDSSLFASQKLGEESLIPVVSPTSDGAPKWWLPDQTKAPIPCLHTHSNQSPWPIKNHIEKRYSDLVFEPVYESSDGTALKEMAIQGFGLAWMPHTLVFDALENRQLVRADEPKLDIQAEIRIYRSLKFNESKVDEFWQALKEQT